MMCSINNGCGLKEDRPLLRVCLYAKRCVACTRHLSGPHSSFEVGWRNMMLILRMQAEAPNKIEVVAI